MALHEVQACYACSMRTLAVAAALLASTMSVASANDEEWELSAKRDGTGDAIYFLPSSIFHTYVSFVEVKEVFRNMRADFAITTWEIDCEAKKMSTVFPRTMFYSSGPPITEDQQYSTTVLPNHLKYPLFNHVCSLREEHFR